MVELQFYTRHAETVFTAARSVSKITSYYNARKVCLSLCLSALFSTFSVAWLRTSTAAFETLGLGYMPPTLLSTCLHGQLEGVGVELPGFLSPLILSSSLV